MSQAKIVPPAEAMPNIGRAMSILGAELAKISKEEVERKLSDRKTEKGA